MVTIFYKSLVSLFEMEEKYFVIGFFGFVLVLFFAGFFSYFFLVREGVSQDVLTVVWGGMIFLFVFAGIVGISLIVRHIRGHK